MRPCTSDEPRTYLSQSMMRLSWMLELNPIISMYLTVIIAVLLQSIMAPVIMLMFSAYDYNTCIDRRHGQNVVFFALI